MNLDYLSDSFIYDNFISNFFINSKKTDEEFNQFINVKFTQYLNNTNLLANIIKDFETNKTGQSSYCNECENLYILTNSIFDNYIKKVTIPFNITINDETTPNSKKNYKNKILYFFHLEDLKKVLTSEEMQDSSDDELNKKKILCKIISVIFIKIYIIIKAIHETFNNYKSLVSSENESIGADQEEEQTQEQQQTQAPITDNVPPVLDTIPPDVTSVPQETVPQETVSQETVSQETVPQETVPQETVPQETVPQETVPQETVSQETVSQETVPQETVSQETGPQETVPQETVPTTKVPETVPTQAPVGGGLIDNIRDFFPFNKTEEPPNESEVEVVNYKQSKNMFYSIFIILFADYYELNSTNFNEKILIEKLELIDNAKFSKNLSTLAGYFCKQFKKKKLFDSTALTDSSIIFDDNMNNLPYLNLKVDFLNKKQNASKPSDDMFEEIQQLFKKSKEYLTILDTYITNKPKNEPLLSDEQKNGPLLSNELKTEQLLSDEPKNGPLLGDEPKNEPLLGDEPKNEPLSSDEPKNGPLLDDEPKNGPVLGGELNDEPNSELLLTDESNTMSSDDHLLKNINSKAYDFIKDKLKEMIRQYFHNRRYLYVKIIKNIVVYNKKNSEITKLNDRLTYAHILTLTEKTKYKILELNFYNYKYSNKILKVFCDELKNLEKKEDNPDNENIITRTLNSGFGGRSKHNKINAKKRKTMRKRINTRKKILITKNNIKTRKLAPLNAN